MNPQYFPWQRDLWQRLLPWRMDAPHAVLLHGAHGSGKVEFARALATLWLCEAREVSDSACGVCASCRLMAVGNHPDFMRVRPEAVALAEGLDSDEDDGAAETEDGGEAEPERRAGRAPSRDIRIGQIHTLIDAVTLGTHRQGRRVVLLYPAESMNPFTANALLKVLEEPPAGNHLILVTDAIERLLPTVLSRCQKVAMPAASLEQAQAWLAAQGVDPAARWLAQEGGAPLAALRAAQADPATQDARTELLAALARGANIDALGVAAQLARSDRVLVVGWLQRWVWDCLGFRLAQRVRYYPDEKAAIAALAAAIDPVRLARFARVLNRERRAAEHPLNARLFFEDLFLRYAQSMA